MAESSRKRPSAPAVSGPALVPAGELSGKPPIPLTRPIIVAGSRDTCRIHLISRSVSKAHALIVVTRHTVFVRDLCSREGTLVNGDRVVGDRDLAEGDILKIGRFEFIFTPGRSKLRPQTEPPPPPGVVSDTTDASPPVPLEGRTALLGRKHDADVQFTEPTVSAAHAVIVAWEGKRYIRDLGSRTGTFVNGKSIHQQELRPGDVVRIGDSDLAYQVSTIGEAGVVVVESPTESTVAKALSAQELLPVESSGDDTLPLSDVPDIAEPDAGAAREELPALDVAGTVPPVDEEADIGLSRRGWHRANGKDDGLDDLLDLVKEEVAEQQQAAAAAAAAPAPEAPPASRAEVPPPPVPVGAVDETTATIDTPLDLLELLSEAEPKQPVAVPIDALPVEPAPETHATLAGPISMELEAEAAAEAALTTAETTVAAMASADDVQQSQANAAASGAPAALPLTEPGGEPADAPVATAGPTAEVIAPTEPSPESAQPLEMIGPATADAADAVAADAALPPSMDLVAGADTLSDTAFSREVSALTDPAVGDPVIVDPPAPAVEPESVASEPVVEPVITEPVADASTAAAALAARLPRADVVELALPAEPPPAPPVSDADVVEVPRDLDLRAEPAPIPDDAAYGAGEAAAAAAEARRAPIEPTLPLAPPDPAALAEDHSAHAELPLEPLPPVNAGPSGPDVAEPIDLPGVTETAAVVDAADVPVEPAPPVVPLAVEPIPVEPVGVEPPAADADAMPLPLSDSQIAAAIGSPEAVHEVDPADAPALTVALPPEAAVGSIEPSLVAAEGDPADVAAGDPPPTLDVTLAAVAADPPDDPADPPDPLDPTDPPPADADHNDPPAEDRLDVAAAAESNAPAGDETAFAVVVPPPPGELALPAAEAAADAAAPRLEDPSADLPTLEEPPVAPRPAPNVAHDLGPAPVSDASSSPAIAIPPPPPPGAGDEQTVNATISLPPPLPPDAPSVTDAADDDDAPSIAPAPTPRRPRVIRDGFNRRRGGSAEPSVPEVAIGGSPFAGARGQSPVDPFAAPPPPATGEDDPGVADAASQVAGAETEMPPMQPTAATPPPTPSPARRRGRPAVQPMPTFANGAIPTAGAAPPPLHTDPSVAAAAASLDPAAEPILPPTLSRAAAPADEVEDLHEERRRRLRRIPTFAILSLLLIVLAGAGLWFLVPVYSTFETAVKFQNFTALTMAERRDLQSEQSRKLRNDAFRRAAARTLVNARPNVSAGFLASPVEYDRAIQQAGWPEGRPGEFVLRYRGKDAEDRYRLHAMAMTLYGENYDKIDNARRVRNALKELNDAVESNTRKLADTKERIERERMLGETRPTPAQLAELEQATATLEKAWGDALVRLKEAQAEQDRLEKALAAARTNPPPPPESDPELMKLEKELAELKARYEAAQSGQSAQSASAREELDAAMESFNRQLEAARGLGGDSPELANYITAAENLQRTTRELIDEFIDRQTKQTARLNELKAKFDERSRQRITEMREGDPQLRDMREQREVLRRQLNAANGSDGQVGKEEIAALQERLRLLESAVTAREEVLNNDPVYAEAIASLQAIIDQTEQELVADRKRADQKLEDLQRQFAVSSPAVSGLPEEQRKVARGIQEQLSAVASARRRYADAMDSDRAGAEQAMKDVQARIVELQGDADARRKLLTQEFTTRSVEALTAALAAHANVLSDATSVEAAARAAFEEKGKALRGARDAVALGASSDDRLNELIKTRTETERVLQVFNDQLQFKTQEAKRLVDVVAPAENEVFETPAKDERPLYILIAVGVVLAGFGAATWWTIHSAHRLDEAFAPQAPDLPVASAAAAGGGASVAPPQRSVDPNGNGADEHPEHAAAI